MRLKTIATCCVFGLAASASAETITSIDGRSFELNPDGTYVEISPSEETSDSPVELYSHWFKRESGEYNREFIHFIPRFRNLTEKTIVATKFTTTFSNVFGDPIYTFDGETNETVAPGGISTALLFYIFEDNEFMATDAYSKLLPLIEGNAKIDTVFTTIAFGDGSIFSAN